MRSAAAGTGRRRRAAPAGTAPSATLSGAAGRWPRRLSRRQLGSGDGEKYGPDLTTANRKDRDFHLASIVDPSAVIRREYLSHVITTTDGRTLTGLIVERTPGKLTLVNTKAERISLVPSQVESMTDSPISVMPDGLLNGLRPQEVRDVFGYLILVPTLRVQSVGGSV